MTSIQKGKPFEWEEMTFADRLALKLAAEKSFLNFTRIFFELLQGDPLIVNWHHRLIAEKVDAIVRGTASNRNLAISIPPGGTKTEFMSIHLPPYTNMLTRIGKLKRFRNLNLSSGKALVERNSRRTRDIISSREYQEFWPCSFGVNQAEEWEIVDDKGRSVGQTVSKPMGGQIIGSRGGYPSEEFSGAISLDDPDKAEDMFSKTKREKSARIMVNTVRSRRGDRSKEHPTPVFVIQQRLHVQDTIGLCLDGKLHGIEFEAVIIPALITKDYITTLPPHIQDECWNCIKDTERRMIGGVEHWSYWPEMEDIGQLISLMEHDEYTFMSQYMQKPIMLSGGLVDVDWLGRYSVIPCLEWAAIYVDTNSGKITDKNDYTVFTLAARTIGGDCMILDMRRGKWDPEELLREANDFWTQSKIRLRDITTLRYMKIEDKQAGQGLITTLKKNRDIAVSPVQRGTGQNKLIRHNNVQPQIKAGRLLIPETHREDGSRIERTTFSGVEREGFRTDFVLGLVSELAQITTGILDDSETGYDDQYDTIMDALDDMCINFEANVFEYA